MVPAMLTSATAEMSGGLAGCAGYLQLLLIMFRGLSTGKFLALYEVFGTGPLMPDTLATFRALLDKPFPRHWRAKLPQQQVGQLPGQAPPVQIASLTIEVRPAAEVA